jgi:putative FmdB family regulatory protein
MPIYDQQCPACGWSAEILVPIGVHPPCPTCAGPTERIWRGRSAGVVDDTIIGGEVCENLGHTPVTFYSKSEKARYLKAHQIEPFVRHAPQRGSDKSPHTTRWI